MAAQHTVAGTYVVRVTGSDCTLESAVARLHVKGNAPEVITVTDDLEDQTKNPGQSVTFRAHATARASGTGDSGFGLVYSQWRHRRVPIGAATACSTDANGFLAELTLTGVECEDAGDYSVVFYNPYGAVLSGSAQLTVAGAEPLTINATVGGVSAGLPITVQDPSLTIELHASTCIPAPYLACAQWYRDGEAIANANENQLICTIAAPITCEKLGLYKVVVFDSAGSQYQATAVVDAQPSVSMESISLELNPSGGGTWDYFCYERAPGAGDYTDLGLDQNWLVIPMDGTKDGYWYKIEAHQGAAVAVVILSFEISQSYQPQFTVRAVQNGTTDVKVTAADIGLWAFTWLKLVGGDYVEINEAHSNFYEIPEITGATCSKQGAYRVQASDPCLERDEAVSDATLSIQGCQW